MVRLKIMSLQCPGCGNNLDGLNNDVVYFCRACRKAFEAGEGGFTPQIVVTIKPRLEFSEGVMFWLPVWLFDVGVKVDAVTELRVKSDKVLEQYPLVWVSGYRMWRSSYFGNPGYLYTSGRLVPEDDTEREPPHIAGCCRGMKEAVEFVKPFLLSVLDRRIDVAPIDISGEISKARLLAVPYVLNDNKVMDTQIKWEYPSIMFEDLPYLPIND